MKSKKQGFSTAAIVVAVIIVAILVVGTFMVVNHNKSKVDYASYMGTAIVEGDEGTGQVADHVKGNADAPVIIHEYANFQCNHCADMDPIVKEAIEASNGKLGVVFRNMTWSSFQNSKAAAAAAEAAGLQGYWDQYAAKLFEQQAEWGSATGDKGTQLFDQYFEEVTDGKGDLEKFKADIESDEVAQKVEFDTQMAQQEGAQGTPAFFYEGQLIDMSNGGDLNVGEQTIHYDEINTKDDLIKLFNQIIEIKTGLQ